VAKADPRRRLEGLLVPGRYDVQPGLPAADVLRSLLETSATRLEASGLVAGAQSIGTTPYQVLVISSLVEKEAITPDMAKVARVIYNRLAAGMKLQMDSTVHYVVGKDGGVYTTPEQRRTDSPYNTYLYKGLPPTPINSPTRDELRAAINPAQGSWLYFTLVNLDTGETAFASNSTEHEANVKKLQTWCQAHKGRC